MGTVENDFLENMRNLFKKLENDLGEEQASLKFVATTAEILREESSAAAHDIVTIFEYNMRRKH